VLDAAHGYLRAGLQPVALHGVWPDGSCTCRRGATCRTPGKHPADASWSKAPRPSGADVQATWDEPAHPLNVGVLTGEPSGVFVVDIDPDHGGDSTWAALEAEHGPAPRTRTHRTGSGGRHLFFRLPGFLVGNSVGTRLGQGIDVRGTGGQVVAPPSVSARGTYAVLDDAPVADAPGWLQDRVRPARARAEMPSGPIERAERLHPYAAKAVAEELARLDTCTQQGWDGPAWDSTTYAVACNLLELANSPWSGYSPERAHADLLSHAPRDGGFTPADHEAKWRSATAKVGGQGRPDPQEPGVSLLSGQGSTAAPGTPAPCLLDQVRATYLRWLGDDYDLGALEAVLAAAAVEQLGGDPVWLLIVSGSGAAKTETVAPLAGAGAFVTSTITSEGALLSATSKKDKAQDATGGLLRKIGERGVLVIKDFTSILSMNRDSRAAVLAALREVYDGKCERNVGTDGGRTLTWTGRIALIGAVTTAYDSAHAVIASMGDRFALVRVDSNLGRRTSGRQALRNVDHEVEMRAELAQVTGGLLASLQPDRAVLTDEDMEDLLGAADLVTLARTAVERDYRGEVVEAHAPEMPTRFAKMLGQVVRGCLALGMTHDEALAVSRRVARDSMPPLRLLALEDVAAHPGARTSEVTKRVQKPRSTVDRVLQELHVLGLLEVDDADQVGVVGARGWQYRLSGAVDPEVLARLITRNVSTRGVRVKEESSQKNPASGSDQHRATDIPGDASTASSTPWPGRGA
jgi:hypothetical protein